MIYYDVTDLVRHAEHSTKVTGVQRVVLEGMRGLGDQVVPVFLSPMSGRWYTLPNFDASGIDDLEPFLLLWDRADLIAYPTKQSTRRYLNRALPSKSRWAGRVHKGLLRVRFWRRRLNQYTARFANPALYAAPGGPVIQLMPHLTPDDQFVLFGTPWNAQADYDRLFATMDPGVDKVFMVYDLIPLNSPFVPDNLRDLFRTFIPFVIKNASRIIVASDSIASDLRDYAGRHGYAVPVIHKVQLAHHLPPPPALAGDVSLRIRKLFVEKYALCVGSIESRKNHLNLLVMWSKFFHSSGYGGEKLVIAGGWAWDFHAIQNLLHETGHVYGSVIVIERPDDTELRQLFAHCRFTVYPSHYEGWGLPVGESLSFGKPCLHFDNSSLREAGMGLTDVVPYHDLTWFYDAFCRLMTDDQYYKRRCDRISRHAGRLRSWGDVSKGVADVLRSRKRPVGGAKARSTGDRHAMVLGAGEATVAGEAPIG